MATEYAFNPQDTLSALADGQLRGEAFAQAVEQVERQAEAQLTWHAYHVVGDVLRSNDLAFCADDQAFLARFQSRLAQEPILAPSVNAASLIAIKAYESSAEALLDMDDETPDPAANAPRFGWKLLAGVASLVAVMAVSWNVLGGSGATVPPALLAQVAEDSTVRVLQPVLASSEPQVMLRDARLDALMAAHQQFGGTSALQMPAGFLRNATFESSAP